MWVYEVCDLYLATRVLRGLPNVQCALGDRLVEVLCSHATWWRLGAYRVSFDVFFDGLPIRGHLLTEEQAWWELQDLLRGDVLEIVFSQDFPSQ